MGEEGKRRSGRVKAARGKWKGVEGWKMRREIKEKARVGKGMKEFETPSTYWHLKDPLPVSSPGTFIRKWHSRGTAITAQRKKRDR